MSTFLYLVLALPILILLIFLYHYNNQAFNLPPGPPALPFIGNLLNIDPSAPHLSLYQLSQKYGPLMTMKQGRDRILVVSSANMAHKVLKTHDHTFCSRPSSSIGRQMLSYNYRDVSFAPYDTYWREMRKICVVHFFNRHMNMKAVLMDIFIAGTETSAATIIWAMTYLIKNPISMKKVQNEVRQVVGKARFVNEEDIRQLPYLKAVIKETMRLQPAVPLLLPRVSTQECSSLGGYKIPDKTLVYVNAYAISRDAEAWGENFEEFRLERFIVGEKSNVDVKGLDFEVIPFGAGRRMCPGIHMGLENVEVALANLVYGFDWEMPVGMKSEELDMEALTGLVMHKKNDLCLLAKKYT